MSIDERFLQEEAGVGRYEYHPPVCQTCGYDLRGSSSGRCPECGAIFVHSEWRRAGADIKMKVAEVDEALQWLPFAWKLVLVGMAIRLAGLLPFFEGFTAWLIRGASLVCGFAAFFLALNVFRVRQLPTWAKDKLKTKVDQTAALIGIFGGIILVAVGLLIP